ncbi:MAG TPA: hypothetical protein VML54_00455 [Candidatus Limnocylindrales bacterium]|nr:hypothetical protein [Candidatus Limnocylindrales bacterium]
MPARKTKAGRPQKAKRSPKAGRPPGGPELRPQAKRRQRAASVAVKKGTTLLQTDQGTQVAWGANQRRKGKV